MPPIKVDTGGKTIGSKYLSHTIKTYTQLTIKAHRRKLVEALRSGKYKKTEGLLRKDDRFCVMGVACDVYNPKLWKHSGSPDKYFYDDIFQHFAPPQIRVYYGFSRRALMEENDRLGWSLNAMADYIEEYIDDELI